MRYTQLSVSERRTLPPAVAVSTVACAIAPPAWAALGDHAVLPASSPTLWMPLVRRTREPFLGLWALPGGPTQWDETLSDTASRTLFDAVQAHPGYLEQLYSFGGVERSAQAQRLVTIAYWALFGERDVNAAHPDTPRRDDRNVAWFAVNRLPALAFDHATIIEYALERLKRKAEYTAIAHRFLGNEFTLGQLREVTEAVRGERIDPANFRRHMLAQGHLIDTGRVLTGNRHRPARLYHFAAEAADGAASTASTKSRTPTPPAPPAPQPHQAQRRRHP